MPGVGFVHPTQVDVGGLGGDFVGIGTANGRGVAGSFCEDDYDPGWTIYVDRIIGGVYSCTDYTQDVYTTGSNPSFEIAYKFCPGVGANRWVMTLGGVQWTCIYSISSGGQQLAAGLETTGPSTTDRNIDVKYTNMMRNNISSSTWQAFGSAGGFTAPNYTFQFVSTSAFNVYLAPLD